MATLDPNVLKAWLGTLSEAQKRQLRAKKLRGEQEGFKALKSKEGGGNYTRVQSGGAQYAPIAKYHTDYGAIGNNITGSLGEFLTGRQADKAEQGLSDLRNPEFLKWIQEMSSNGPTSPGTETAAVAAPATPALSPPPPEAVAPPAEPAVPPTAKFNIVDLPPEANQKLAEMASGLAAKGVPQEEIDRQMEAAIKEAMGTVGAPAASVAPPAAPGMPIPGASPTASAIPPVAPPAAADITAALGMPPTGGAPAMPPTAAPTAAPMPPPGAAPGAPPTDQAIRAYLGLLGGGDMMKDIGLGEKAPHVSSKSVLADKTIILHMSDGSTVNTGRKAIHDGQNFRDENTGEILNVSGGVGSTVTGGPPDTGAPPVAPVAPAGAPPAGSAPGVAIPAPGPGATIPAPGAPIRMSTTAEIATAKRGAELDAEIDRSAQLAAKAGEQAAAEATAKGDVEFQQAAIQDLPKMELGLAQLDKHIPDLLNSPGLAKVIGKGLWAKTEHVPFNKLIEDLALSGTPEADVLARLEQLKGEVFLPAFQYIKGGGQVTNLEGDKAQAAMGRMRRAQSLPEFKTAMQEFLESYRSAFKKRQEVAQGKYKVSQFAPGAAKGEAAPGAPLPSVDEAMQLFGGG